MSSLSAPAQLPDLIAPRVRFRDRFWHHPWRNIVLLTAFSAFLFFYGINKGEFYRTESLRAIVAAEFLRSGNWIVPILYGKPLLTKPPGMYAAIALASWPIGHVTEWSARLPSALAAVLTVFLFYGYFGRELGRSAGLLAAFILPMSLMWLDKATAAEIDMMQVGWVAGAVICFLRALEIAEDREGSHQLSVLGYRVSSNGRVLSQTAFWTRNGENRLLQEWGWWLLALLCVTGGVLTKWTAPAFFYGMVVPLLWWRGRLRLLFCRPHLVSAFIGASICFAWAALAIRLAGWGEFYNTVSQEALMRLSPHHHHRPYPWRETMLHPLALLATNLPWSILALMTLKPGFAALWDERRRRLLQALHCWTWPNMFFWTIIPEHAVRHSFPFFPAIAGLATLALLRLDFFLAKQSADSTLPTKRVIARLLSNPWPIVGSFLGAWLLAKVVFVHAIVPARKPFREPRAKGELIARLVPHGEVLYLFQLKDEGIMFYYGKTVRRLPSPTELPCTGEPLYCILDEVEWRTWNIDRPAHAIGHLQDEQGAPVVLIRVEASTHS